MKSTYDFELISYVFTYVRDVFIKTESVIHSYSKQFNCFLYRKGKNMICVSLAIITAWCLVGLTNIPLLLYH